jgi:eukaryotic translation initiation factor 2C
MADRGRGRGHGRGRGDRGGRRGGYRGRGGRGRGERGGGPVGPLIYPPNQPVALPPRLTDESQEALIDRFEAEGGKSAELPLRPGYGTLGTEIKLRANFFTVKLPEGPYYDYSVTITDVTPESVDDSGKDVKGKVKARSSGDIKSSTKRRIFELMDEDQLFEQYRSLIVHDHSQRIIAAKELPQPLQLTITYREDSEEERAPEKKKPLYEVTIQFLGEVNLGPINRYCFFRSVSRWSP